MIALAGSAEVECRVGVLEPACGTIGDVVNVHTSFQGADINHVNLPQNFTQKPTVHLCMKASSSTLKFSAGAIAGMDAIPQLIKVLECCDDEIVLRQACWALSELACDNFENCIACVEAEAIPHLVKMCMDYTDAFLLEQATRSSST